MVDCPDLSMPGWDLARPGLCGRPRLVDLGGVPNLLHPAGNGARFDGADVAAKAELPGAFLLGAGAASPRVVGANAELMINEVAPLPGTPAGSVPASESRSRVAWVLGEGDSAQVLLGHGVGALGEANAVAARAAVEAVAAAEADSPAPPPASTGSGEGEGGSWSAWSEPAAQVLLGHESPSCCARCSMGGEVGLLANLLACEGAPGRVVRVRVARRTGGGDLVGAMRRALLAHFGDSKERCGWGVGVGGWGVLLV